MGYWVACGQRIGGLFFHVGHSHSVRVRITPTFLINGPLFIFWGDMKHIQYFPHRYDDIRKNDRTEEYLRLSPKKGYSAFESIGIAAYLNKREFSFLEGINHRVKVDTISIFR